MTELDTDVVEQAVHQPDAHRKGTETEDQQREAADRDERPEARLRDEAKQR